MYKKYLKRLFPRILNQHEPSLLKRIYFDIVAIINIDSNPLFKAYILGIRDFVLRRFGKYPLSIYRVNEAFKNKSDSLLVVLDIGGIGKNQVKDLPGQGKVRVLTLNLHDEADIMDDATKLNKIEDNSLDGIYSSHLIEHFWWWELESILKLWYRKLKVGGRIEIRCPDIEWIFKKCSSSIKNNKLYLVWEDVLLHNIYGAGVEPWHRFYCKEGQYHRNILWKERLKRELRNAGFYRIRRIYYFKDHADR